MLDNNALMDKLYTLPKKFVYCMERKDYSGAKHCYDTACTVAVFLNLDESIMTELFGERGERGAIIKQGLFQEEKVLKAYYECIRKNQTYENKRYPGIPGTAGNRE